MARQYTSGSTKAWRAGTREEGRREEKMKEGGEKRSGRSTSHIMILYIQTEGRRKEVSTTVCEPMYSTYT